MTFQILKNIAESTLGMKQFSCGFGMETIFSLKTAAFLFMVECLQWL